MSAALTRPNLIARGVSLLALAVVVVVVILLLQGGSSYGLNLEMTNANGIRPGSQVLLGGVPVGTVSSLNLGPQSLVVAHLSLNPKQVKIGQGVQASIIAANLLGEEYVSLQPGNQHQLLPSGTVLAPSKTTVPTDLDQLLDVFNASTQERLAILINEMGIAVAGRKSDVSAILRQLPLSAVAATNLLDQLVQDNHTLADTVANSNQFIARMDQQKTDLGHVIDAASGAAITAADQAGNLSQSLIDAPQALTTARRFLLNADQTSIDLTPAAAQIGASAGPLNTLLEQVKPFEQVAVPALNKTASVAPELTRLAIKGTPIVKQAVPTVVALSTIAGDATQLTHWAGLSVVDLLAAMQGWSSGLQFRDGLGHVFHAELGLSPGLVENLASFGLPSLDRRAPAKSTRSTARAGAPATSSAPAKGSGTVAGSASGIVSGAKGAATGGSGSPSPSSLTSLLNYLLGK